MKWGNKCIIKRLNDTGDSITNATGSILLINYAISTVKQQGNNLRLLTSFNIDVGNYVHRHDKGNPRAKG